MITLYLCYRTACSSDRRLSFTCLAFLTSMLMGCNSIDSGDRVTREAPNGSMFTAYTLQIMLHTTQYQTIADATGDTTFGADNLSLNVGGRSHAGHAVAMLSPDNSQLVISVGFFDPSRTGLLSMSLKDFSGEGTYQVGQNDDVMINWTEVIDNVGNNWSHSAGGTGSIVITEFTEQGVSGTFAFHLSAVDDNDPGKRSDVSITSGRFSIIGFTVRLSE